MAKGVNGFEAALERERARNARQISSFRFFALVVVLVLQLFFLWLTPDWTGAPLGPLLGYTVVAGLAWRLRRHFLWPAWSGYTIALLDMPMTCWLIHTSAILQLTSSEPHLAYAVLMLLPLTFAGFIVMASLALDVRQTVTATMVAVVLQGLVLTSRGHDLTFVSMITAFTLLLASVCVYWRDLSVRLVRETSIEQVRRERLGRYFSPQVAALVEGGVMKVAERREVTVLFADLRGFTGIAERLDSREVVVLLNRFHSAMVSVVFAQGGTLDKYLGDGLMVYFGAPMAQDDQALRGVRCALEMQRALAVLNEGARDRLRMGIGLHCGTAVVGDIGADSRREFTVIGDTVNVAARLEKLTKELDADILVSGAIVEAVGDAMAFRLVEHAKLRGRSETVDVYTPV